MGKKKNKNKGNNGDGGEKKNDEEHQQQQQPQQNVEEAEDADVKKSNKSVDVVLKVDLHCDGCASKVVKCIRAFEGVQSVKCEDGSNKLTVIGDVDPVKLREKVEQKTRKKVELLSPVPKKENKENKNNNNNSDDDKKGSKDNNKKPNEEKKKSKELPITTAVMKVHLHCEGCIQKIHKAVTKTAGYREMKVDRQKELVTVTGAMDMKALAECLKKHLKKNVEIVPPKKDGEKKEKGDGGANGEKKKGDRDEMAGDGNGEKMEQNKMQVQLGYPNPLMYPGYVGGMDQFQFQYQPYAVHAPQIFSDENPNACIVM